MSDFLTRLVERTQGKVQVAQPVIPPMFASVSNSLSDHSEYSLQESEPMNVPNILNRSIVTPPANDPSSATLDQSFQRTSGKRSAPHRQVEPDLSRQVKSAIPGTINGQTELGIIEHSSNLASPENLPESKPQKEDFSDNNDFSTNKNVPEYDQNTRIVAEKSIDTKKDVSVNDVGSERLISPPNLPDAERNQNIGQRYKHPSHKKRDMSREVINKEPVSPLQEKVEVEPGQNIGLQPEHYLKEKQEASKEPIGSDDASALQEKIEVKPLQENLLSDHSIKGKRTASKEQIDHDEAGAFREIIEVKPVQKILLSEQSLKERKDAPKEPIYLDRASASRKNTGSTEVIPVKTSHLNPRSPGNIRFQKDAETESSAVESTIKVTIGRVEVRAIMPNVPSSPAKRANSQGPILSLNDYLKQRNEGKR